MLLVRVINSLRKLLFRFSMLTLKCTLSPDLTTHGKHDTESDALRVSCWLRYGDWKIALCPPGTSLSDNLATEVLLSYKRATDAAVSK